jgi:hypothetical protein
MSFHSRNPWVYDRIEEMVRSLQARGFKKYSMRTIVAVLRFEYDLKTGGEEVVVDGGETIRVKLNNNHASYYARMWRDKHPDQAGFFNYRRAEGEVEGEVLPVVKPKKPMSVLSQFLSGQNAKGKNKTNGRRRRS